MAVAPTGEQWTLRRGSLEAVIVEVGGGLRTLTADGVDVVAGYPETAMPTSARGQILAPWPNRIRDGRYRFGGEQHVLPITERATGTASHGLVRWTPFAVTERDDAALVVHRTIHPRPGYPFIVEVRLAWSLDDDGLRCAVTLSNVGATAAPVGFGAHPYLALGGAAADAVSVEVPADRVVLVDERDKIPQATVEVTGTPFDLRAAPKLGAVDLPEIDHAYTGLGRGPDGCWEATVATPSHTATVWGGEGLDWVQVFTGKAHAVGDPRNPPGIAIEPLSCPADAFSSGDGLITLQPGERWAAQWGIGLA